MQQPLLLNNVVKVLYCFRRRYDCKQQTQSPTLNLLFHVFSIYFSFPSLQRICCTLAPRRKGGDTRKNGLCSVQTPISWTSNAQVIHLHIKRAHSVMELDFKKEKQSSYDTSPCTGLCHKWFQIMWPGHCQIELIVHSIIF